MDWARILAFVTGMVDRELLARNEYLVAENRILKAQLKGRLKLSDAERATLAEIGHRLSRRSRAAHCEWCPSSGLTALLVASPMPLKSRTVASYRDLRDWIDILRQQGEVEEIRGTSWDLEIGALIEIACRESAGYPPSLLFRDIPGYASDRRVPTSLA
jgi:hypothetical protein